MWKKPNVDVHMREAIEYQNSARKKHWQVNACHVMSCPVAWMEDGHNRGRCICIGASVSSVSLRKRMTDAVSPASPINITPETKLSGPFLFFGSLHSRNPIENYSSTDNPEDKTKRPPRSGRSIVEVVPWDFLRLSSTKIGNRAGKDMTRMPLILDLVSHQPFLLARIHPTATMMLSSTTVSHIKASQS
jgi:hypothetical protein